MVVEEDVREQLKANPKAESCRQAEGENSGRQRGKEKKRPDGKQEGRPLYISLDKDVLRLGDAFCNWSQGVMSMGELEKLLTFCYASRRLLGLDICGEISVLEQSLGDDIGAQARNDALNAKLAELCS